MSFLSSGDGQVLLELDAFEAQVLTDLLTQVLELVEPDEAVADDGEIDPLAAMVGIGTATEPPRDPALARLFPDAYRDDETAAGDFRRFTEERLRRRKLENAALALDSLQQVAEALEQGVTGPAELDERSAAGWLGALNDLRLVIGTRLGVEEDDDPQGWLAGPDADTYRLYYWLGFLQDDLLDALVAGPG